MYYPFSLALYLCFVPLSPTEIYKKPSKATQTFIKPYKIYKLSRFLKTLCQHTNFNTIQAFPSESSHHFPFSPFIHSRDHKVGVLYSTVRCNLIQLSKSAHFADWKRLLKLPQNTIIITGIIAGSQFSVSPFIVLSHFYLLNHLLDFISCHFIFLIQHSQSLLYTFIYVPGNIQFQYFPSYNNVLSFIYIVSRMTWHNIFIRSFHQVVIVRWTVKKKTTRKRRRRKSLGFSQQAQHTQCVARSKILWSQ